MTLVALGALGCSASAQAPGGVKCSAFLHERDGAWRAFQPGVIYGPRGPIPVKVGQRFRRGKPSAQDYVARGLEGLCATN